jgi:hypothetical protein
MRAARPRIAGILAASVGAEVQRYIESQVPFRREANKHRSAPASITNLSLIRQSSGDATATFSRFHAQFTSDMSAQVAPIARFHIETNKLSEAAESALPNLYCTIYTENLPQDY